MENQLLTYWGGKGKYQNEFDTMWKLVPSLGEVKIENNPELEMAIERVRQMNRLYYDFYNNGCCNVVEIERVECFDCGGTGIEENSDDDDNEISDCSYCNGESYVNGEPFITEYYAPMVDDLKDYTGINIEPVLKRCGERYGSYDFPDTDCKELEEFADMVLAQSWKTFQEQKVRKDVNLIKTLYERKHKKIKLKDDTLFYQFVYENINELKQMKVSKCLKDLHKFILSKITNESIILN